MGRTESCNFSTDTAYFIAHNFDFYLKKFSKIGICSPGLAFLDKKIFRQKDFPTIL